MKVKIASFGSEGIICAVIVTPLSLNDERFEYLHRLMQQIFNCSTAFFLRNIADIEAL